MIKENFQSNKTIFYILTLALLIRILFNIFYVGINDVPTSDAQDYHQIALNLLYFGTYNSPLRPPLFPFLIAILYKIFGINYFAVRIVLSIFGSLTCLIVYKIAKEIFDRQVALIAAFISSVYWMMFYWCGFLLTETLCTFFLTLAVLYLIRCSKNPRLLYFIYGGMYLGLSALTRSFIFPFFLFLPLWAYFSYKNNLKLALKSCAIITLTMFFVILPWIVRNYSVTHRFIPITSQSGRDFLGSNNPEVIKYFKGGWIHPVKSGLFNECEVSNYMENLSPEEASNLCWKKGISFVSKNPLFTTKLVFYKFKLFWHLNSDVSLASLQYFFVFLFAIYGLIISLKKFSTISILYLLPVFFTIMSLIFWGDDRIRSPIEPIFVIFAAYGIARILNGGNSQDTNEQRTFS